MLTLQIIHLGNLRVLSCLGRVLHSLGSLVQESAVIHQFVIKIYQFMENEIWNLMNHGLDCLLIIIIIIISYFKCQDLYNIQ